MKDESVVEYEFGVVGILKIFEGLMMDYISAVDLLGRMSSVKGISFLHDAAIEIKEKMDVHLTRFWEVTEANEEPKPVVATLRGATKDEIIEELINRGAHVTLQKHINLRYCDLEKERS